MVTYTLTNRQAERIRLLLWNMDDDGPRDEGWKVAAIEGIMPCCRQYAGK
jgi:hypothetical protein